MASSWLYDSYLSMRMGEDALAYLWSRGARDETISRLGITEWDPDRVVSGSPPGEFSRRFGKRGERLASSIFVPFFSPCGTFLGFEARSYDGTKVISEYRTREASWAPVLFGNPSGYFLLESGYDAWVVEGIYDYFAVEWVLPERTAPFSTLRAHFSPQVLTFFSRFSNGRVCGVYDNDQTGQNSTHGFFTRDGDWRNGAVEKLRRLGVDAHPYKYSGGKDPGELWKKGGVEALKSGFGIST